MKSNTVIRCEGMNILIEHLGKVDAEKFISLIIKEPFDYTRWQSNLWENKSVKEISSKAMKYRTLK